jgi:hypothetical protein
MLMLAGRSHVPIMTAAQLFVFCAAVLLHHVGLFPCSIWCCEGIAVWIPAPLYVWVLHSCQFVDTDISCCCCCLMLLLLQATVVATKQPAA